MASLDEFLARLLDEGRIIFRERRAPASPTPEEASRAAAILGRAFDAYRLEVAGPPVPFHAAVACAAGELVRQASWALIGREERAEDLGRRLAIRRGPAGPSDHLSADLVFRLLPQVHRRARAIDPADPLVRLLADLLRQWPLSGVLSDLDDGPTPAPDLGDHRGVALLYAERWAEHRRPAWRPAGLADEYAAMVLRDRMIRGAHE